jgi:hypothetical protein
MWPLRSYISAVLTVLLILSVSTLAFAQWVRYTNNVVGPNGYLLDGSSAFLLDDVDPGNGKIFAR